jgi:hypothetical protein
MNTYRIVTDKEVEEMGEELELIACTIEALEDELQRSIDADHPIDWSIKAQKELLRKNVALYVEKKRIRDQNRWRNLLNKTVFDVASHMHFASRKSGE